MNLKFTLWSSPKKVIVITVAVMILVAIGTPIIGANKSDPYKSSAVINYERNCNSSPPTLSGTQGGYSKGWSSGDGSPQATVAEVACSNLDSAGAFGTTLYVVGNQSNIPSAKSELNAGLSGGSKYCFLVGSDWLVTLSNTDGRGSNDLQYATDAQTVQSFMGGEIEGACDDAKVVSPATTKVVQNDFFQPPIDMSDDFQLGWMVKESDSSNSSCTKNLNSMENYYPNQKGVKQFLAGCSAQLKSKLSFPVVYTTGYKNGWNAVVTDVPSNYGVNCQTLLLPSTPGRANDFISGCRAAQLHRGNSDWAHAFIYGG